MNMVIMMSGKFDTRVLNVTKALSGGLMKAPVSPREDYRLNNAVEKSYSYFSSMVKTHHVTDPV